MSKLNDRPLRAISTEEDLANMIRNRDAFVSGMGEDLYEDSIAKLKAHIATKRKTKMKRVAKNLIAMAISLVLAVIVGILIVPFMGVALLCDAITLFGRLIAGLGFRLGSYVLNAQIAYTKVAGAVIDGLSAWRKS